MGINRYKRRIFDAVMLSIYAHIKKKKKKKTAGGRPGRSHSSRVLETKKDAGNCCALGAVTQAPCSVHVSYQTPHSAPVR